MENENGGLPANLRALPGDIRGRLLKAVREGEVSEVDWILSRYELLPEDAYLMVTIAAKWNQLDTVKFLARHGCPVNLPAGVTPKTSTPYDFTVLNDNQAIQRFLLESGADPKLPNPVWDYPKDCILKIFEVVKNGEVSAADRILSRFGLLPEDGYLMIGTAVKADDLDMTKLLLRHGVPVNAPASVPFNTPTPFSQAIINQNQAMGRLLLENGAVM